MNKQLENICKTNSLIFDLLSTAKISLSEFDYSELSKHIENSMYLVEKNLIQLRELYNEVNLNFPHKIQHYFGKSVQNMKISVERVLHPFECYSVTFPFVLPHKQSSWTLYKDTIAKTVYYAVADYCKTHSVTPFENSSLLCVTHYNKLHKKYVCDNDHKELTEIINTLIGNFIVNDNGANCDLHIVCRETTGETNTKIYITEQKNIVNLMQYYI